MLRSALASASHCAGSSSRAGPGTPAPLPDLPQLLQQRNHALEARRRERADMQVSSARAELVGAVLGSWSKAPKAAREDTEKYLQGEGQQGAEATRGTVIGAAAAPAAHVAPRRESAPPAADAVSCRVHVPPTAAACLHASPAVSMLPSCSGGAPSGRGIKQRGGGGGGRGGLACAVHAPPRHVARPQPAGGPAKGQVWCRGWPWLVCMLAQAGTIGWHACCGVGRPAGPAPCKASCSMLWNEALPVFPASPCTQG